MSKYKIYSIFPVLMCCNALAVDDDSDEKKTIKADEIIVVTGSRQDSALIKFAGNIDRISAQDIALVAAVHPGDVLNRATGVHVQTNNGMESLPSIRSPVLTGPGAAGAYLFLEDGVATRAAGFANNNALSELNLAQAQEIEVIRGPASAAYGSNAVHGIINVLSRAPNEQDQLTLMVGPNRRYQLQGTIGSELNQQHGLSANFQVIDDGGYRDDSGFNVLKLNLHHDYSAGDDHFNSSIAGFVLDQQTAGFISSNDNTDSSDALGCYFSEYQDQYLYRDQNAMRKNCDNDAYRKWSSLRMATRWQRTLSDVTNISITPYFRTNTMEFRQHYLPSKAIEENSHDSVGLLSSYYWQINPKLSFVSGVDLESTRGELSQTQQKADSFGFGKARQQGLHYDYKVTASVIAPYFQGDWQASKRLTMSASVRFDVTKYRYDNLLTDGTTKADGTSCVNNSVKPVPCLYLRPGDRSDKFENTSSKLGFNYQIGTQLALFGDWSQGFRAPQTTDLYRLQQHQQIGKIDSEQLESSEIGLRGVSEQLTFEIVYYEMTKQHVFFRDAKGLNVTDGETSHRGLELSANYDLSENVELAINYNHGRHQYEFNRATSGVIKGNDVDTAPRNFGNIRVAWLPSVKSKLELEWLYIGKYYLDPANKHQYNGHNLLQLRGSLNVGKDLTLFARIENITDQEYASRADYAFGSYRFFGGQARAVHLGMSMIF